MTWVYGRHPVMELLEAQPQRVRRMMVVASSDVKNKPWVQKATQLGLVVEVVSRRALEMQVGSVCHQGVAAATDPFSYTALEDLLTPRAESTSPQRPVVVALDQVQDPHNVGSLIRSAYALGAQGLVFPKDRACEVTPAVIKAAAGATAHLPLVRVTNLCRALGLCKDAGWWVMGADPHAPLALEEADFSQPTVVVLGSEGMGLRHQVKKSCDTLVHIPMQARWGSLNVAVAGAVCLYEAARQRRGMDTSVPRGREGSKEAKGF